MTPRNAMNPKPAFIFLICGLLVCGCALSTSDQKLDNRSTTPLLSTETDLDVVAALNAPPGNIAVSPQGRIFISFHPEAGPDVKIAELAGDVPKPYPDAAAQQQIFKTPLALRIDRQNRLWVLDYASHGFGTPHLVAFDLDTGSQVHEFAFPGDIAGLGSMLNDFQVAADGRRIYIADTSIWSQDQAIIVYDTVSKKARRRLHNHASVINGPYAVHIGGQRFTILGFLTLKFGVDAIALSRDGQWLYYAPLNGGALYRVPTAALNDADRSEKDIGRRVEKFADITMSDGITTDNAGNIYLSDMENSAIHRVGTDGKLDTLFKDPHKLRWPDGFSFGPGGFVYLTDSALQHVILKSAGKIQQNKPYFIYRFDSGYQATPGH